MIEIAPETACVLYLAFGLITVVGIWLATRKKDLIPFTMEHRTCEFCHHNYLESSQKSLSRCPQCNLITKR